MRERFRLSAPSRTPAFRARDPSGRITETRPFQVRVVPPWDQSAWIENLRWPAIGLVLAVLVWRLMRARMWRLERERLRLAETVRKRPAERVQTNGKLRQMAEVDGLTGITNRRDSAMPRSPRRWRRAPEAS
ncbi:MAG: hypothetical protein ACPGJE_07300 [Wenzhouxiangellaceae bacterium]